MTATATANEIYTQKVSSLDINKSKFQQTKNLRDTLIGLSKATNHKNSLKTLLLCLREADRVSTTELL